MSETQKNRVVADWSKIAGEVVEVEKCKGVYYAYGSEIACLRLAYKFRRCNDRAAAEFSKNLNTWFFRLEAAI